MLLRRSSKLKLDQIPPGRPLEHRIEGYYRSIPPGRPVTHEVFEEKSGAVMSSPSTILFVTRPFISQQKLRHSNQAHVTSEQCLHHSLLDQHGLLPALLQSMDLGIHIAQEFRNCFLFLESRNGNVNTSEENRIE